MTLDIKYVNDMESLIAYFSGKLGWNIDPNDFYDIDDVTYDFDASDLGLKEEVFAKIASLKQLRPLVDNQRWGIFFVKFDSLRFEVSALRKILSGLIPSRRNSADHAVWDKDDLLFICTWGEHNRVTVGAAHFGDSETGLPQIKMISCEPVVEDFTQINVFEQRISKLAWPEDAQDIERWRADWSSAFTTRYRQTIQDSHTLTVRLAEEAQGIRDRILQILEIETHYGYVHLLYAKFRNTLVHDMTEKQFADMYAQTVVYGLFSARCMDKTQDDFSAVEAVNCIPNTNPFLKSLMRECVGDSNRKGILSFDELEIGNIVELLRNTRTDAIIADFNRQTGGGREDPVIHFYEEFLTEYDKTQKVQRGVYYTPQPVVNFIVRAVDDILKHDFGIADGLAATSTKEIKVKRRSQRKVNGYYTEVDEMVDVPTIQVLDPATGTGTFIRQTILQIYKNFCESHSSLSESELKSAWNSYVPEHLFPRINAFELMMAPYAVAHMKLAMVLKDTGFDFESEERLRVYLTNSLEKAGSSDNQLTLFNDPLSLESVSANAAKKNNGINIVLGNPPYNVSSTNKNEWILSLITDYKTGLTERKLNLDDDYIKFIRYAQTIIDESSDGVFAFITNNSYIDGITHRRMRQSLLASFTQIYVLDLHGNVMKQEKCKNGERDENVFDITQGVAICIMVKKRGLTNITRHFDLMGSREKKYDYLNQTSISEVEWERITPKPDKYLFIPFNSVNQSSYDDGVSVAELFKLFNSGIQTKCDEISVAFTKEELSQNIAAFQTKTTEELRSAFPGKYDSSGWNFNKAKAEIIGGRIHISPYYYRPFDYRYTVYTGKSGGFIGRSREVVMQHIVGHPDNYCLCMMKQFFQDTMYNHILFSNLPIDERTLYSNRGGTYIFPLFLYSERFGQIVRSYNFNLSVIKQFEERIGKALSEEKSDSTFTGKELVAYIYATLYSNKFRIKFNSYLKYDFPRIPLPDSVSYFNEMVELGDRLITIHMPDQFKRAVGTDVELPVLQSYSLDASKQCILINKVLRIAVENEDDWGYEIGGYKPLQKWLKDRKGLPLTSSDIYCYKKIVDAISETRAITDKIDEIIQV